MNEKKKKKKKGKTSQIFHGSINHQKLTILRLVGYLYEHQTKFW